MKPIKFLIIILMIIQTVPVTAGTNDIPTISITLDKTTAKVGEYIEAVITVENITALDIMTPIHFNSDVVRVVSKNGSYVESGLKDPYEDIGITPLKALNDGWGGTFFINDYYPYLHNENGFYRLSFTRRTAKEIVSETLISIRFIVIGAGDADIRFADQNDKPYYDTTYIYGACFLKPNSNPRDSDILMNFQEVNTQKLTTRTPKAIKKTIKNISDKELNSISIIAVYDGNQMVELSIKTISIPAGESDTHECEIGSIDNEDKHFLFNDLVNIAPLTGALEVK